MTDNEITAEAAAKAQAQQDALVAALRNTTPLGRLNHAETRAVLELAAELGYAFAKTGAV